MNFKILVNHAFTWPIIVHMSQLVSQFLNLGCIQARISWIFFQNNEMRWSDCSLADRLRNKEKIFVLEPGHCVIHNCSRGRVRIIRLEEETQVLFSHKI